MGGSQSKHDSSEGARARSKEQEKTFEEQAKSAETSGKAKTVDEQQQEAEATARKQERLLRQANEAKREAEERVRAQEELLRQVNEAKRAAESAKKDAESAKRLVEERTNELRDMIIGFADDARRAREEERKTKRLLEETRLAIVVAREAQEQAEREWREGFRPIVFPTQAQMEATKRRLQYNSGFFHIAVAGISGSGKSSLINAFRGLRNKDKGAARTGVVETTSQVVRYPDSDPDLPYTWYDVPGAGTLSIPDWQYFADQGLYIFNCIIIAIDSRFTASDIAILRNCARFQIPAFIARSKSAQHIRNLAEDMNSDTENGDEEEEPDSERMARARKRYIQDTRNNFAHQLREAGLLVQRVYLVEKDTLVKAVKGKEPPECIDEMDLIRDMFALANEGEPEAAEGKSDDMLVQPEV
ncbi:P-loop containing nucleoside triphosphate hydrolase protein [Daedalea quercina L-15889]|uniref:p-loop containing nucleoside triphosphate hydrolase protein n=1 Tax=Daedalea quercina L-15889 TaxID=1314783 RepID=A0A165QSU0_9APHY|nr:P-loop containing nucleoside triphosphate hydrolase protein [Daedalea quercina L-15889]